MIPSGTCVFAYLIEIPCGDFGFHILACPGDIDSGYAHFHKYLFVLLRVEMQQCFADRKPLAVVHRDRIGDERVRERFGELGVEVNVLVERPISSFLMSADFRVTDYFDFHSRVGLSLQAVI